MQASKRAKNLAFAQARSSFRVWIQKMALPENHHAALFSLTKESAPAPTSVAQHKYRLGFTQDPLELLAHRRLQWTQVWNKHPDVILPSISAMEELRVIALQHPLDPVTPEQLDDALWSFKDKTGKGLDCTGPRYFKHLPAPARSSLAQLLTSCDTLQAWPWQTLGQAMVFLGKFCGGERTVAFIVFVVRL